MCDKILRTTLEIVGDPIAGRVDETSYGLRI